MKITCSKSALLSGVNTVAKAVPSRTTMPVLECILIDTTRGIIQLTANDMELGIETTIDGTIEESGKVAIEARLFSEIVRTLPDNIITIESDKNFRTSINCEKASFSIEGRDPQDFVELPDIERDNYVTVSQFSLKEIIRQTIFSIAFNDSNQMMSGELLDINGDSLRLISLDGQRISIRKISLKNEYEPVKAIIPGKTMNEIGKILTGGIDDEVKIYFTDLHILFEFDNTVVVSRLIEGEYFQVDRMISKNSNTKVTINKKDFQGCIGRAALLIRENERRPIIVSVNDDSMSLKIQSSLGSFDDHINVSKSGQDIMIGFNPKFVLDALKVIDDEEINIYFVNARSPFYISDEEGSYIYLVLPISFNM